LSITRARSLRRRSTRAERALWQVLRDRQPAGAKFRRQCPIGPFIVDFICMEQRLIVEADGGQHGEQTAEDLRRTRHLESEGYRVLRFWNNDVLQNLGGVLQVIEAALEEPSPRPSP